MKTPGRGERKAVLDAERAVNEQYRRRIDKLLERTPGLAKEIALSASQPWTTSSLPRPEINAGARSGIVGRVVLEEHHPWSDVLGATFYVAGWRIEEDDFETVNWAAPVAGLFFEGRCAAVDPAESVLGRRSFVLRLDDIVDYHDETEDGVEDPFARRARPLDVPAAPVRRQRPKADNATQAADAADVERDEVRDVRRPYSQQRDIRFRDRRDTRRLASPTEDRRPDGLRAEDALLQVIDMPKTGRMGTVLPTMQPDQYQLVSWPGHEPLIVQGQPGTGKTVVAAHRAVYLTSEERERESGSGRVTRVAIVGPTERYVEHVGPIVAELQEAGVEIRLLSLPRFLSGILRLPQVPRPKEIGRIESSWDLGRVVDSFVRSLPARPPSGPLHRRVEQVVEGLKVASEAEVADAEIRLWLQELPPWSTLKSDARYLPMLATVAMALDPRAVREPVGHLIVDEAQDVRPIEWRILSERLLAPQGQLSLFGDINQRRSDWTAANWPELARDLELTDDAGHPPVVELGNGYRSTRQILRLANRLLPRGSRGVDALRDGPEPLVRTVTRTERIGAVAEVAVELAARHEGLVAVITVAPRPVSAEFRRCGWSRGHQQDSWESGDLHVIVLHPDQARGLEFDAAVVVEPADFPENVGRQGVLYTSLTRANKELAVVHAAALPRDLRH